MAWRVLEVAERKWKVTLAAERRSPSSQWNLLLSFRAAEGGTPVWANYPLQSNSRSSLFLQAEQIPDRQLAAFLAERLR